MLHFIAESDAICPCLTIGGATFSDATAQPQSFYKPSTGGHSESVSRQARILSS